MRIRDAASLTNFALVTLVCCSGVLHFLDVTADWLNRAKSNSDRNDIMVRYAKCNHVATINTTVHLLNQPMPARASWYDRAATIQRTATIK